MIGSSLLAFASSVPIIYRFVCDPLTKHSDTESRSLRDQRQLLVLSTLSKLDSNGCRASYVLVVDALDECDGDNDSQITYFATLG